ncbi:MAG: hypothetical protein U0Q21_02710 [Dermatophilaceae bacterium]
METADLDRLLEAHVAHELASWSPDALASALRDEVAAVWEWLERVTVADLAPAAPTSERVASAIAATPLTDELIGLIVDAVLSARSAAADSGLAPADLLGRADLDDVIDQIAGMEALRNEAIRAFTESTAYHRLVAHVLYHGIKGYVLTENVFARRLPGASSMVKLGQRGLNAAAPKLEDAVDKRLSAFVQANIGDTLRDSRRYLESTLDAATLHDLVDEAWTDIARHPLATGVDIVTDADLESLTVTMGALAQRVLASGLLTPVVQRWLSSLLEAYAECQVAALLTDLGADPERLAIDLAAFARPLLDRATADGVLEARIRARLSGFYRSAAAASAT